MHEFEWVWENWRIAKSERHPRQPELDNWSYYLLLLLQTFEQGEDGSAQAGFVAEELVGLRRELGPR